MEHAKNPFNQEKGELRMGKIRSGVMYKGQFIEFGSIEYKNLMLIEGKKPENKNTLLGIISEHETKNPDNITDRQ